MEPLKLQHKCSDYRFIIAESNLLSPEDGPAIALERVQGSIIVAYSDFARYVGATQEDASRRKRLFAVCRLLTHLLHSSNDLDSFCLADILPVDIYMYEAHYCPKNEVIYVGEFLYNLACAGHLHNINPKDILFVD